MVYPLNCVLLHTHRKALWQGNTDGKVAPTGYRMVILVAQRVPQLGWPSVPPQDGRMLKDGCDSGPIGPPGQGETRS